MGGGLAREQQNNKIVQTAVSFIERTESSIKLLNKFTKNKWKITVQFEESKQFYLVAPKMPAGFTLVAHFREEITTIGPASSDISFAQL